MQRRDFVKAMMAASVTARAALGQKTAPPAPLPPAVPTAPGPVPWMRGLMGVKPLPMTPLVPDAVAETSSSFFSDQQMATLRHLSEILQPPYKGYPGAAEAGTPDFLDFLIGVSPSDRQQLYQSGLDRLEREAQERFNKSFANVDAAQADQLLRPWLRTWINEHPPTEPFADFINIAHTDIREATINSQAWSDAARRAGQQTPNVDLYWYPVDPDLNRENASQTRRPATMNKRN
jgi:gluconate 2-dehydrogenase subunit 3-like protein